MKNEFQELGTKVNKLFTDIVKGKGDDVAPRIDVYETQNTLVYELDLPGFEKADVRLQVVDGSLVIQGKRKRMIEEEGINFRVKERKFGAFQREFALPEGADPAQIKAKFEQGVLVITLPYTGTTHTKNEVKID